MVAIASPVAETGHRPAAQAWQLLNDANGEDNGQWAKGGLCIVALAGATLLIGDAVFISGVGTVNKSTVAGDRLKRVGLVIGGIARSVETGTLEALQELIDVGETAGIVNDPVLVAVGGLAYAVADGAIGVGAQVTFSAATAGRVTAAASAAVTDAMGVVGQAFDAAGSNGDKIRVLVGY